MSGIFTRWARIVLASFAPIGPDGIVLRDEEVDWALGWERFSAGLSARARLGARIGMLIGITAPLWTMGRFVSLAQLSIEKRAQAMDALLRHPIFMVRELSLMLKVCASFTMFRSSEVRARSGYDLPEPRRVRSLPVLAMTMAKAS